MSEDQDGKWMENQGTTSKYYICKKAAKDKDRIYISQGKVIIL